ncbi:septum site-determining protein MinC [Legionella adelaidensis]|nr:septum site-determining protein MinC [Legionella adelaidensis]
MTENVLKTQAFKLKGRLYTLTVISLLNADSFSFAQQLEEIVTQAPKLFANTPVVLDCSAIKNDEFDLGLLCKIIRNQGLIPVGLQGANAKLEKLAHHFGLAILKASAAQDKKIIEKRTEPKINNSTILKSKLLNTPVRSGQQVVSKTDLIINASVSPGAELLADGNIHVYGVLRGRALAGIAGDKQARIFCQSLDAELVSIAGFYRLSDAIEKINGPCQVYIQDDRIQIERL